MGKKKEVVDSDVKKIATILAAILLALAFGAVIVLAFIGALIWLGVV